MDASEEARIERIFAEWRVIILTVGAACLDVPQALQDVEGFLPQLERQEQWATLAQRIRLLLAGDRNAERLLAGLDATDTVIMTAMLQALEDPELLVNILRQERDRAAEDHEH